MKKLIIGLVIAALLYCAYWFIASRAVASGAHDKIEQYRAQGYTITHSDIAVGGFPARFNADIGPVSITAPAGRLGNSGVKAVLETADISAAAYMPLAWTLTHSGPGQFDIPAGPKRWIFETQTRAADIEATAGALGGIKALKIDAQTIAVTTAGSDAPPVKSVDALNYSFNRKGDAAIYTVLANDITLVAGSLGQVERALGSVINNISGVMNVAAYGSETPSYESNDFSLLWGPADMGGAFNLTRSNAGLSGTIALIVANEQALIKELTAKGILSSGEAMLAGLMIGGLPKTEDGRRKITLKAQNGDLSLGPIKLGRLPF